ncbi:unnamed protein product [Absidia cylindrospora]
MPYKRTSTSSLIDLANQLYSPEDRHQYTKVILKKERMMAQIEIIQSSLHHHCQQYQLERQQKPQVKQKENRQQQPKITLPPIRRKPHSTPTQPAMRHSMSSYSMLLSKSASMYQPKLLEQYDCNNLSMKQIDMLSNQYNNSNKIEELLLKNISSSTSSSSSSLSSPMSSIRSNTSSLFDYSSTTTTPVLKVKTSNLSNHHHINQLQRHCLPLSPPLSPPMSSTCLATSYFGSLPDSPKSANPQSSLTQPLPSLHPPFLQNLSPPLFTSSQLQDASIDAKNPSVDIPTTSTSSPIPHSIQQCHDFTTNDNNQAPFYYPTITHIQKVSKKRGKGTNVFLNSIFFFFFWDNRTMACEYDHFSDNRCY